MHPQLHPRRALFGAENGVTPPREPRAFHFHAILQEMQIRFLGDLFGVLKTLQLEPRLLPTKLARA